MCFEDALMGGDLDALPRCPKSDLHNHFVLGGDRLSTDPTGDYVKPLDHELASMAEMHAWLEANVAPLDGQC